MNNKKLASPRAPTVFVILLSLGLAIACSGVVIYQEQTPPTAAYQTVHYQQDVQPIFDAKCVACHSCNDAPCQLKLTSAEGVMRGASKKAVYDGLREEAQEPTRLGVDALRTADWRDKGFFSARYAPVDDDKVAPLQASLLYSMVELGHRNPWVPNSKLPDDIELGRDRKNECPTMAEFRGYAKDRPKQGMPWAVTGLTDPEFQTLQTWVAEGSFVEPSWLRPTPSELESVEQWERYLNRSGARERLVARYLFEHLFLAHLYFTDESRPHFFELVRSHTPPGQDLIPLATTRPNDDPGGAYFYRFRLITETLVEKTHITYALSEQKRVRYDKLFFGEEWTAGKAPGYAKADRANAFATFAAIPAKARYEFMLDDAEYFIRSFIRGPVCSGQIATDVIRDQFWVMFENPATERYVNDAAYRQQATPLIGVPGEDSDLLETHAEWEKYREQRNRYISLRQAEYAKSGPRGPDLDDLWNGDGWNRDALLTIFRHHDNAAVKRGLHGAIPETLWVMDYPLLERSYYQLVVNFNVFGNVSHQLQTRLYFDLIRNEGEYNFLRFLPSADRDKLRRAWYADLGKIKLFTTYAAPDDSISTQLPYGTGDSKTEFASMIYGHMSKVMGPPDVINRCESGDCIRPGETDAMQRTNRVLRRFAATSAAALPVIKLLPELVVLRVTVPGSEHLVYSLAHNRAHSNVAFLIGEERRLEPEKDTLTIAPGTLGSYPNFIFDIPLADIGVFAERLAAVTEAAQLEAVVQTWGVRRTRPDFWDVFHDLTRYVQQTEPIEASLFDLSRYDNL
ncbi:MAG: fatty acid cis/trans isomerase [Panacagrimonas sp.]